jgi:hypothetical protein
VAGSTTNAAVTGEALRRAGVLTGLLAWPIWASVGYLHQLAWEFVYGWAPIATFVITGLLIVILAVGGARSAAAQAGKWFRGHAARPAGGRVDLGRVSG